MEDATVRSERHNAFLNSRTSAVIQTNNRCTHLEGEVHELVDLFSEHFTKCATEHGEVLREDENFATFDGAPAGDDTVCVWALFEAGSLCAVASKHVEFME